MDCKRLTLVVFFFSLWLPSLVACSPRADRVQDVSPPKFLKWIKPDIDPVAVLAQAPAECLSPEDLKNPQIILGRTAFRSPFLLGGQATRRGLTCNACHSQGQKNAHFFIIGLSSEPGTADVTNFHFSDVLGDEVFNPTPIPSLSDDLRGVNYDPALPDLDDFVLRLITKEFTGATPDSGVFAGLQSYLRALDNQKCSGPQSDVMTLKNEALLAYSLSLISDGFNALRAADYSLSEHNFMIAGLRHELGELYDRFPQSPKLMQGLKSLGLLLDSDADPRRSSSLDTAFELWTALVPELEASYESSLYSPEYIRHWAEQF